MTSKETPIVEIDNEPLIAELVDTINDCQTQMASLLTQMEAVEKIQKEAEEKLKKLQDKEKAKNEKDKRINTTLTQAKTKAETLRDRIKKAQEDLKARIETSPK